MRHPLRRIASQGAWYALGNLLVKLSGLILLPIYTNARFLPVADYGRWGVLEISAQLSIAVLGLSLAVGLIRFYNESGGGDRVLAAAWWITASVGLAAAVIAGLGIFTTAPIQLRLPLLLLLAYVVFELQLAIVLAMLRAEERAGGHTALQGFKLLTLVIASWYLLVHRDAGLLGVVGAYAAAHGVTLIAAILVARRREFLRPRLDREMASRMLRFSVPLVAGGLGSMVLNAGDRYILAIFRAPEEIALYTLAGKFGGVVNMFVVQPFNMAYMPLLFRLEEGQRREILRLLLPYLMLALCGGVVGLSLLAGTALKWMGSDPAYREGVSLLPWLGLGFAAYGLSTVWSGVLALFHRTREISAWVIGCAVLNLVLNTAAVPILGALGAAITTLVSYAVLAGVMWRRAQGLLPIAYPWVRLLGMAVVSFAAAGAGAWRPFTGSPVDWIYRGGVLMGWIIVLVLTRWFTWREVREALQVLRSRSSRAD